MSHTSNGSQTKAKAGRSKSLEWVCDHVLPNCHKALALVEKGIERPLSGGDKLSLKYHGRLCPFCGCNEGKFSALLERYKVVDGQRQRTNGQS